MAYEDHFKHADDVVAHLNTIVPAISDPWLQSKYTGFVAVVAVTVYELAIKEIFIEFARRKHKVLGHFTESFFDRINGRIKIKNIREDYIKKFGDKYDSRFQRKLDNAIKLYMQINHRDIRSSYSNLIIWRNNFSHEGRLSSTATYSEAIQAYEDGKEVLHCLAASMTR